jgi:site-specific DNA recombinase
MRIRNLVFPEGLSIRAENREYLTKKVNGIFGMVTVMAALNEGVKMKKTINKIDGFFLVAGTGLEPVTFGL